MKDFSLMYEELDKIFILSCFDEEENIIFLKEFEGTTTIAEVNKFVINVYGCVKLELILANF